MTKSVNASAALPAIIGRGTREPPRPGDRMATSRPTGFLRHLGTAALVRQAEGVPDAHLLGLFVEHRDQAAFEALVRRHGPMVWGVCRRTLRSVHDAEDAFQATFLVLVRKAPSVAP